MDGFWGVSGNGEVFYGEFDTKLEATLYGFRELLEEYNEIEEDAESFHVGQYQSPPLYLDAKGTLEILEGQIYDETGIEDIELGGEEILQELLDATLSVYLKLVKHRYYKVVNVEEVFECSK